VAAVVGGIGSRNAPAVYARLDKPAWAPPAAAFGPVWSTLYAMIGAAGWRLATRRADPGVRALHLGQLVVNAGWSWAFFEFGSKTASLGVIGVLDAAVATEIALLARRDPTAALLLTPYLAWGLYATALNAAVSDPDRSSRLQG
jgi:tryptophan-rich sensory protein